MTFPQKPSFIEGQKVTFVIEGKPGEIARRGTIRGKTFEHIFDIWIVEVESVNEFRGAIPEYPFSCVGIPGYFIRPIGE